MDHIHLYCPNDWPTCFGWGDVGHIQRYCPRKRQWHIAKLAESEKSRQENCDADGEDVYAAAFMASVGNLKSTDKECYPWLIDSGASCHMTKCKKRGIKNLRQTHKHWASASLQEPC